MSPQLTPTQLKTPGFQQVIAGDYCIGCGACAVVAPEAIRMSFDRFGMWRPQVEATMSPLDERIADATCPFSDSSEDESVAGKRLFGKAPNHHEFLGFYDSLHIGRLNNVELVSGSSSGGLLTYVLVRLMQRGDIDGVIHVGSVEGDSPGGPLFQYCLSHSVDELMSKRKSQYHSTEMSHALAAIQGNGKRYAFVGVPCFVKAARALCRNHEEFRSQLTYAFALVCGHMKTRAFAELLGWQVGVPPEELQRVDFRWKVKGRPSTDYEFSAWGKDDQTRRSARARDLFGAVWGHAFFQPNACNFCDDVFGELADACFGDAWLPEVAADWRGANVVVSRSAAITAILNEGHATGELELAASNVPAVVSTQLGNIRHRRDGLSLRLVDTNVMLESWPTGSMLDREASST